MRVSASAAATIYIAGMMHRDHLVFVEAIHRRHLVQVVFTRATGDQASRRCVPLDFGPYQRYPGNRYHLIDLDSPSGPHPMGLDGARVIAIRDTGEPFDPETTITWSYPWNIERSW